MIRGNDNNYIPSLKVQFLFGWLRSMVLSLPKDFHWIPERGVARRAKRLAGVVVFLVWWWGGRGGDRGGSRTLHPPESRSVCTWELALRLGGQWAHAQKTTDSTRRSFAVSVSKLFPEELMDFKGTSANCWRTIYQSVKQFQTMLCISCTWLLFISSSNTREFVLTTLCERVHDNLHTEQRETDYDLPWDVIHVYWECKPRV